MYGVCRRYVGWPVAKQKREKTTNRTTGSATTGTWMLWVRGRGAGRTLIKPIKATTDYDLTIVYYGVDLFELCLALSHTLPLESLFPHIFLF